MITHEEARNYITEIIEGYRHYELDELLNYITQQEKVSKLLELYQTFVDNFVNQQVWTCPLLNKIKEHEEELK